jgi:hypothetical protein
VAARPPRLQGTPVAQRLRPSSLPPTHPLARPTHPSPHPPPHTPQALVDKNLKQRQDFIDEIREQYAELREEFYAGLEDRK